MSRPSLRTVAVLCLAAPVVMAPAAAPAATPKPKGLYLSKETSKHEQLTLAVSSGAISGGSAEVRLTRKGKGCKVPGLNPRGKLFPTALPFTRLEGTRLASSGAFFFKGTTDYGSVHFTFRVRGKFVTSTRATIAIRASSNTGCGGYFKTTKATWRG